MDHANHQEKRDRPRSTLLSRRVFSAVGAIFVLTGCSLDASIVSTESPSLIPVQITNRTDPDFLSGEIVTTTNGQATVRAVFGEVPERHVLSGGREIEGVVR